MCHIVLQVCTVLLVMVAAVVECGAPSTNLHGLTQEEVVMSLVINQMAILKDMNESSYACASHESELRELRLLKEETKEQLQAMEETARGNLQVMEEQTKNQLQAMQEEMRNEFEAMKEEVERQLTSVKVPETVQNASIATPTQQPDPPALDTLHNDTDPSLCGSYKVLYGSRGSLSPSHPSEYTNRMRCEWHVILPEGTRPVFRWEYLRTEVSTAKLRCRYDPVYVRAPNLLNTPRICGEEAPAHHPMYSITDNEFLVTFSSDNSNVYRGFLLHYHAEINQVSP